MNNGLTNIDVKILASTERAVRVHTGEKGDAVWLPLAQIELTATATPGVHSLTLPEWLATREGLI
jgi:hypothetical protein